MTGLVMVLGLVLFALLGPLLVAQSPDTSDFTLSRGPLAAPPGPSAAHWLGTDALYRDVLARLAHGARLSLSVAVAAAALTTAVGAAVGIAAGIAAEGRSLRLLEAALMRAVDVLLALPFLLVVTAIGVAVGQSSAFTVLLVLGLTGWGGAARIIREKTREVLGRDFVAASRALGASTGRVVLRHVLPNVMSSLVVIATTAVGHMILAEAVLGYLTLGVPPPQSSWGRMLHEAEPFLATRLGLAAAPAFAILVAVLGFGRVGDGLRDALDPRGRDLGKITSRLPADLLLTAAALLLLVAIRPSSVRPPLGAESAREAPARGGWLHVASLVNVRSLDPATAYNETATALESLLFARLVTLRHDGTIKPELAREMRVSEGGLRYTFELREGVRFHDGATLTAADVKRSIERTLHPRTPCPAASHYAMIAGFEAFRAGQASELSGVRVLGDRTVEITLSQPDTTFLPLMTLAFMAPVCPSSGALVEPSRSREPCGAGPFRLLSWEPEGAIRLARHEAYFEPDKPYLDGVEWLLSERPTAQRYKFEEGTLDYVRELGSTDSALYRADPAWSGRWRLSPSPATNAIFMNTELPPFDQRAIRRAVAMAIDPSVLESVRVEVRVVDRVLPATIPGPPRDVPLRRHDLSAALLEMAKAGYAFDPVTGKGGYPRPVDYLAPADTFEQQAAEVYAQQLAKIGIRLRLRLTSFATYLADASRRRATPMGFAGWKADFPDPSNFFEPTLSSSAIADEGSQNYAFFSNAELDRVLQDAHGEQDPAKRMRAYARAEEIVRDEAPWAPTYTSQIFEMWQPYVRGYEPHPLQPQRFNDVWIDAAARSARARGASSGALGLASLLLPWPTRGAAR